MRILSLLAVLLLLSACAETELAVHAVKQLPFPDVSQAKKKATGYFKIGRPYKIDGKIYRPKETYNFSETGIASWYGPNFHGKQTANGEIFDQNELTAAHRTLQMPALVRVTNLENGRSLVVRINDRGPFSRGRIIDLSKRSAELLGFKNKGTAKVRVDVLTQESLTVAEAAKRGYSTSGSEVAVNENRLRPIKKTRDDEDLLKPVYLSQNTSPSPQISGEVKNGRFMPGEPNIQKTTPTPTQIYVQAGAFSNEGNAVRLAENLSLINTTTVQTILVNGKALHRVRMGPLASVQQADSLLSELTQIGHKDTQIIVD